MKPRIFIFIVFITIAFNATASDENNQSECSIMFKDCTRSSAAGFAGTLKFFIGRAARDCSKILGENESYINEVVQDWLSRNSLYSSAAEKYVSLEVSAIANTKGLRAAYSLRDQLLSQVELNSTAKLSALLGNTDESKTAACSSFKQIVHAGQFDITPSSPEYENLIELVQYVGM